MNHGDNYVVFSARLLLGRGYEIETEDRRLTSRCLSLLNMKLDGIQYERHVYRISSLL